MIMKKAIIKVDWYSNYAAVPENEGMVILVTGDTMAEIKEEMESAIPFHIEGLLEDGDPIPEEFQGEYELEYHLTSRALMHYTEALVSRKELSKVTGINVQQLSHYANGWRNPKPATQQRIIEGLHEIGRQLLALTL